MARPEDSEYEVACMAPGVGKLDVFPSIWGRKRYLLPIQIDFPFKTDNFVQIGQEALVTVKRT